MRIKVYSIKELATLYYPDYTPESASKALVRLIKGDAALLAELQAKGFAPGAGRILTPLQVRTIVAHLGDPE